MHDLNPPEARLRAAYAFTRHHPFPVVSEAAAAIHQEFARSEPDVGRLVELISTDISLTGQVLKSINSAGFGFQNIGSLQHAVSLLGLDRLHHMVAAGLVSQTLQMQNAFARQLWEDSLLLAATASRLAGEVPGVSPDEAYLAGLMLDSGAIFLAERMPQHFERVFSRKPAMPMSITRAEDTQLGVNHATVGYLFACHWKLPEAIALAVYLHHDLACRQVDDEALRGLLGVLKLADYLTGRRNGLVALDSMEQIQFLANVNVEEPPRPGTRKPGLTLTGANR